MLAALCVAPTTAFIAVAPHPVLRQQAGAMQHAQQPPTLVQQQRASTVVMQQPAGEKPSNTPFFLDPNTKGGIVFYTIVLCALPFFLYNFMLENLGFDVVLAGNVILVGYVGLGTVLWTSSYIFRVANKDMTYAQQLRDYENAVIQKRFEELSEDEVDALMGEICTLAGSRSSHHAIRAPAPVPRMLNRLVLLTACPCLRPTFPPAHKQTRRQPAPRRRSRRSAC